MPSCRRSTRRLLRMCVCVCVMAQAQQEAENGSAEEGEPLHRVRFHAQYGEDTHRQHR